MKRRTFLKKSLMAAAVVTTFTGLMIKPKRVFASWPKKSFDITDLSDSIKSVYGHDDLSESSEVKLKAPDIAENGAIVPINIKTNLKNISDENRKFSFTQKLLPGLRSSHTYKNIAVDSLIELENGKIITAHYYSKDVDSTVIFCIDIYRYKKLN